MKFEEISLADAVEFVVDNRGKTVPVQETGFPLIATNCISNKNLYPEFVNVRYVSDETYKNWFRSHPLPEDIILTNKGSQNGAICLVPDPVNFCIAQDMVALRAKKGLIYPKYLFAVLRSKLVQNRIKELNVDSVIPHFKKTDFDKLFFPKPDYDSQVEIGDLYFNFSQKIENNRQTNKTLEQIAQAIFKSWFVDFDPVRAKIAAREAFIQQNPEVTDDAIRAAAGTEGDTLAHAGAKACELAAMCTISGKAEKQLSELDAETLQQLRVTASQFPHNINDSEQGEIPEGWRWSEIGKEVTIVGGGTPSTKIAEFWEGGHIHWTTPKDLSNLADKILLDTERKITQKGLTKISSGLLPANTVLMSSRAPVGYLAITKIPVAINQGYIAMKCENDLTPEYVVQWAESIMDEIKQRASGTTFAEISKKNFRVIPIIVPDSKVVNEYTKQILVVYSKVAESVREIKFLEEIRDTLLPRLLSGEFELAS